MSSFWAPEREQALREMWGTMPTTDIGEQLGTTKNAVIGKANRLGLEPQPSRRQRILPDPIELVMLRRQGKTGREIAAMYGVTPQAVYRAAHRHKLRGASHA